MCVPTGVVAGVLFGLAIAAVLGYVANRWVVPAIDAWTERHYP